MNLTQNKATILPTLDNARPPIMLTLLVVMLMSFGRGSGGTFWRITLTMAASSSVWKTLDQSDVDMDVNVRVMLLVTCRSVAVVTVTQTE